MTWSQLTKVLQMIWRVIQSKSEISYKPQQQHASTDFAQGLHILIQAGIVNLTPEEIKLATQTR